MTELRPLIESSDDELELALLGCARSELPRAVSVRDTALALGLAIPTANALGASLSTAGSLGAAASTTLSSAVTGGAVAGSAGAGGAPGLAGTAGALSFGALGKSLVGGALASFMALTAYDQTLGASSHRSSPPPEVTSVVNVAARHPSERIAAPGALAAPLPAPEPLAAEVEVAPVQAPAPRPHSRRVARSLAPVPARVSAEPPSAPAPAPAPAQPAPAPVVAPERPKPAPLLASLAEEIRVLDQARSALAAGDATRAGRLLDAYEQSRHGPTLTQEAALLRVRLLLARGQRRDAARLARRIIAEHPESAHAHSLRTLASEP